MLRSRTRLPPRKFADSVDSGPNRWKIAEPNAPSPRGYLQLVNRWMREVRRQLRRAFTGFFDAEPERDDMREAGRIIGRLQQVLIVAPTPHEIEVASKGATYTAVRGARRKVVDAGVPVDRLRLRLGITDDDPKYYDAQHGVARFMAFRAGAEENTPFLERWYKYCLDRRCNTFDLAPGDVQHKDFRQHRCEQAIMTNLAHERGIKLYREACQLGNTFDLDRDLYPQLFFQDGSHSFSPRPCVGSAFRNV